MNTSEDVGRHRPVRVDVRLDVPRRGGDPGRENDRVDERNLPEHTVMEEVCAQRDRTADVVTRDGRRLEVPLVEELNQRSRVARD